MGSTAQKQSPVEKRYDEAFGKRTTVRSHRAVFRRSRSSVCQVLKRPAMVAFRTAW